MKENSKLCAVISYITWIGWIIAFVIRDKEDEFVRLHLNQALILNIAAIVGAVIGFIPVIGTIISGIISLAVFVFAIWGIVRAVQGSSDPLPFVGGITLVK